MVFKKGNTFGTLNRGIKRSDITKEKLRKYHTGKKANIKTKEKMKISHLGEKNAMFNKRRQDLSKYNQNRKGKTDEEIYGKKKAERKKEKQKKSMTGKPSPKGMLNKNHKEETKLKQRLKAIDYIKSARGYISPNIGKYERQILDELELALNKKIIRQYKIRGYFVDGYIPELNAVFEVDENGHKYQRERDKKREKEIKKELNCNFIRIKDY